MGAEDGTVSRSRIANYAHPQYPELDDFGDCAINGANGTTFYFRVDWFTPDGLRTWGDGRTIIIGTKGYIEIRKYVDVGTERDGGNHVFLVNDQGEQYINATGLTGYPFFRDLILDSLNCTENAMTQARAFKAAELCLIAQKQAEMVYQAKSCKKASPSAACDLYRRSVDLLGCIQFRLRSNAASASALRIPSSRVSGFQMRMRQDTSRCAGEFGNSIMPGCKKMRRLLGKSRREKVCSFHHLLICCFLMP